VQNRVAGKYTYRPFPVPDYLCVAAALASVIEASGLCPPLPGSIAEFFGVTVPIGYDLEIGTVAHAENPDKWGISVGEGDLERFFDHFGLPLSESFIAANSVAEYEFADTIRRSMESGAHVLCGYDHSHIEPRLPSGFGHVAIVTGVSEDSGLELFDAGAESFWREVDAECLHAAALAKHDGLWLIRLAVCK
jgi:hypothetical protein